MTVNLCPAASSAVRVVASSLVLIAARPESPQAVPLMASMLMPFAASASATSASAPGLLVSSTRNTCMSGPPGTLGPSEEARGLDSWAGRESL
jgi:hypothetical protein